MNDKRYLKEIFKEDLKNFKFCVSCEMFCGRGEKGEIINPECGSMINPERCLLCKEQAAVIKKTGYRKIPEGAVVLAREEYERLKRVEAEKDRLYEIKLDLENQLIEKGWTEYEGADKIEERARKETAEKILKKIYHWYEQSDDYTFSKMIDEIKQFGVEIKE